MIPFDGHKNIYPTHGLIKTLAKFRDDMIAVRSVIKVIIKHDCASIDFRKNYQY